MSHWEASQGASDEWYTPPHIFAALGTVFDLDVAHPAYPTETHVPTKAIISADSLRKAWAGFIWMNPPYGGRNSLEPWLDRFFRHGNGIALVPDRTSAPWFQEAFAKSDAVLFTRKIRFLRPDGSEGKSPSNGSALMAIGPQGSTALDRAFRAGLGILSFPAERLMEAHARSAA